MTLTLGVNDPLLIFRPGEPHDGVSAGHVHPAERDVVPGEPRQEAQHHHRLHVAAQPSLLEIQLRVSMQGRLRLKRKCILRQ